MPIRATHVFITMLVAALSTGWLASTVSARTYAASTDMRVSISAGASTAVPVAGTDFVTWTVNVTNLGPDPSAGATLTAPLPAQVDQVTLSGAVASLCTMDSATVTCHLGSAAVSETQTLLIQARPLAAGDIALSATVTPTGTDATPSDDTATSNPITIKPAPVIDPGIINPYPILHIQHFLVTARKTKFAWTVTYAVGCPSAVDGSCRMTAGLHSLLKLKHGAHGTAAVRYLACPKISVKQGTTGKLVCSIRKPVRIYFANRKTGVQLTIVSKDDAGRTVKITQAMNLKA